MTHDPGADALSDARTYLDFADRATTEQELRSHIHRANTSALIAISEQLQRIANTLDSMHPRETS
jgi:hypothetical protein